MPQAKLSAMSWFQDHRDHRFSINTDFLPGSCYNFGWTVYFSSSSSVCMLN